MTSTAEPIAPIGASGATASLWRGLAARPVLVVILLWLAGIAPFVQELSAQSAPRFALTGAIVDDHRFWIDGYLLDVDRAEHGDHTYSDKAPGQEVLAAPPYAAARLLGADAAIEPHVFENLTLWWVTLWSAGLPWLVLIPLMASAIRRRGLAPSVGVLGGIGFGTMLLPFSSTLYGHVLGACLGYAAWWLLDDPDRSPWRSWTAGVVMGLAVTVEYQVAIVAAVLLGLLLVRRRRAEAVRFVLGAVPFGLLLMGYQWATTGSPFRSGYQSKEVHGGATLLITGIPRPDTLAQVLFGSRGLVLFTPVVLLGLIGLVRRWRRSDDDGAAVALSVCAGFLLLQAGWVNPWGGDGPGPRYVTPMLPFLALGVAEVWGHVSTIMRRVLVGLSVSSMVLATVGDHLMGKGGTLIGTHLRHLRDDGPVPSLFTIALGDIGVVVHVLFLVVVLAGAALVVRRLDARSAPPPHPAEAGPGGG